MRTSEVLSWALNLFLTCFETGDPDEPRDESLLFKLPQEIRNRWYIAHEALLADGCSHDVFISEIEQLVGEAKGWLLRGKLKSLTPITTVIDTPFLSPYEKRQTEVRRLINMVKSVFEEDGKHVKVTQLQIDPN